MGPCVCIYFLCIIFSFPSGFFFFVLYVSFNFILDFIILYYYSLESGLFSNERERKVVYSDEGGGREEQGGVEEEKPITRILCEKKNLFSIKEKSF